jgi:hypothetical protein
MSDTARPPSLFWNEYNRETRRVTRLTAYRMPDGSIEYHRDRESADRAARQIVALHRVMKEVVRND